MSATKSEGDQYALIVATEGKTQKILVRHLMLLFNYRYGLDLVMAKTFYEGFSATKKHEAGLVCSAAILDRKTDSRTSLSSLNFEGRLPLFVVVPQNLKESYEELCQRLEDIWLVTWEDALSRAPGSLLHTVEKVFTERSVGEIFSEETAALSYEDMQERVAYRIRNVKTLPTLPEVAMRIMAMAQDPEPSIDELEEVITSDPAIVHKLLQVVNTPLFAGSGHKDGWSLRDAIVRIGMNQVGAIAQQIKLMNALVKPGESLFDLRRFWVHPMVA